MNVMTVESRRLVAGKARARLVAVGLVLGALAAAVTILARPLPADDFSELGAVQPVRDAVWIFGLAGGLGVGVAYLCAGLAACLLARGRGSVWASIGAACTGLGGLLFGAGFFAFGAMNWYASSAASRPDFFEYVQDNAGRVFGVQAAGFGLSAIGFVLIAVGLWRSRSVPRWLAVAIPVSLVVMVLSGTGIVYDVLHAVFMATIGTLAWYLVRSPGRSDAVASER